MFQVIEMGYNEFLNINEIEAFVWLKDRDIEDPVTKEVIAKKDVLVIRARSGTTYNIVHWPDNQDATKRRDAVAIFDRLKYNKVKLNTSHIASDVSYIDGVVE